MRTRLRVFPILLGLLVNIVGWFVLVHIQATAEQIYSGPIYSASGARLTALQSMTLFITLRDLYVSAALGAFASLAGGFVTGVMTDEGKIKNALAMGICTVFVGIFVLNLWPQRFYQIDGTTDIAMMAAVSILIAASGGGYFAMLFYGSGGTANRKTTLFKKSL